MSEPGATVVRLPNRPKAREEASLWLARLDRGLTEQERRDLGAWLEEDRQHTDALLELAAFWDQTAVLSQLAELFPLSRQRRTRPPVRAWTVAGAALAGAMSVVVTVFYGAFVTDPPADARQVYETTVGGQSTVELLDGTMVTLNTNSSMEVQYSSVGRSVVLNRGEGYFAVEPDPERPFRVSAGGRVFEAVGTAFNVRIGPDEDIKMMVTEGQVGVLPADGAAAAAGASAVRPEAIVDAGNLAIVGRSGVSIQPLPAAQIEAQLSWQQGMLVFDGEPLATVLLEMGRYTRTPLVVDDSVRDVRVGGYFRAGDVDGLLIALRENFEIESTRTGDGRIILSTSP